MPVSIHETAVIEGGAQLGVGVEVGPYAIIGPHVQLGDGSTVGSHAVLSGRTTLGARTRVFPHAAVGFVPQDLKYKGEPTRLEAGEENVFREFCTVHIGTEGGGGVTRIGSRNLMMAYSHVAHDCTVGDENVLANGATLAGHVTLESHIILGGLSAVHQYVRVGAHAFIAGGAMVVMDIPPFCTAHGDRATLVGLNTVGMKRGGYDDEQVLRVKNAYRTVFRGDLGLKKALSQVRAESGEHEEIAHFIDFIAQSERGVARQ